MIVETVATGRLRNATKQSSIGIPSGTTRRMLNSNVHNTAIFPTNTGAQPVLASMFGFSWPVRSNATTTTPSDLGQSFETICFVSNSSGQLSGIHAVFGNSGLVPLTDPTPFASVATPFQGCTTSVTSVGADENGNPTGFPIIDSGIGSQFRCLDTNNSSSVQDNTFVRPYYDLARDAVILASGTTQLALTCSVSIPSGDDVSRIKVQWIKS